MLHHGLLEGQHSSAMETKFAAAITIRKLNAGTTNRNSDIKIMYSMLIKHFKSIIIIIIVNNRKQNTIPDEMNINCFYFMSVVIIGRGLFF